MRWRPELGCKTTNSRSLIDFGRWFRITIRARENISQKDTSETRNPMKLIHAILSLILTSGASACFAQNLTIMNMRPVAAAEGAVAPTFGEFVASGGEMARPEWRDENGKPVARLVLKSESGDTAAWMLNFRALNLPEGAQMFLYGGVRQSIHGPFEGHGPVNVPDFSTELIAGNTLTIEIRGGSATQEWPFTLDSVEQVSTARLAELRQNGMELRAEVKPTIRKVNPNPDIRTAYVGDRLVKYEVIDEQAIFEGDMVLGKAGEIGSGASASSKKSNGQKEGHITTLDPWISYWPAGIMAYRVRYTGAKALTQGGTTDLRIQAAIAHWNSWFPGILKQRTNETAYVTFEFVSAKCQSDSIGRTGSEQFIQGDSACSTGTFIHEIGHAMGLYHEQSRPDRNSFVTVNWGNIQSGMASQFEIPAAGESAASGSYDYGSVMHYSVNAFSSNGNKTLTILGAVPPGVTVGQRNGLSPGDRNTIRSLYCSGVTTKGPGVIDLDFEAGGGQFYFMAPGYCSWTVTEQSPWIKLTSVTTGSGPGSVSFTVTANTSKYHRSGSIIYNGRSTTVRQEGTGNFGKQF